MQAIGFTTFKEALQHLGINHAAWDSPQCKCLSKYLAELGALSCVVEYPYTDAGYLSDYVGYYARCHADMPRFTRRLHFFSLPFEELSRRWQAAIGRPDLLEKTESELNAAYLGFVVIRPLPATIIGRTCLRTYKPDDEDTGRKRHFGVLRTYPVLIHGLRLEVQSIAFQQQDKEIAACATAAIWFTMHALPDKFTAQEIPSPFEITTAGWDGLIQPMEGEVARKFPAMGLDVKQIVSCLRKHGLECTVYGVQPDNTSNQLLECVAGYVHGGYPMLVVSRLYVSVEPDHGFTAVGLHATTVLGYAYEPGFIEGIWAKRIKRLFAHDDGIGPFTSFSVLPCGPGDFVKFMASERGLAATKAAPSKSAPVHSFEQRITSYLANESGLPEAGRIYSKLVPAYFIIPTHAKVRFPYETVSLFAEHVREISRTFGARRCDPNKGPPKLAWSIRLTNITEFKRRVYAAPWIERSAAELLLRSSLPRFLWCLAITERDGSDEVPTLEFVFDGTALQQDGGLMHTIVSTRSLYGAVLDSVLRDHAMHYFQALESGNSALRRLDAAIEPCVRKLQPARKT
jgi:hypothetical protein